MSAWYFAQILQTLISSHLLFFSHWKPRRGSRIYRSPQIGWKFKICQGSTIGSEQWCSSVNACGRFSSKYRLKNLWSQVYNKVPDIRKNIKDVCIFIRKYACFDTSQSPVALFVCKISAKKNCAFLKYFSNIWNGGQRGKWKNTAFLIHIKTKTRKWDFWYDN